MRCKIVRNDTVKRVNGKLVKVRDYAIKIMIFEKGKVKDNYLIKNYSNI